MYHGNELLRGHNEVIEMTQEQVIEYAKCSEDVFYFAKYFCINQDGIGFAPIKLRPYQEKVVKVLDSHIPGKNNAIIMQGRQTGKTTIATLYLTWLALFKAAKTIVILANKEEQALEVLSRIQDAYLMLPLWLQQGINPQKGGWSKKKIGLDNNTIIKAAASSSSAIRGNTVDYVLVDEFAHLENNIAKAFLESIKPTQESRSDSKIIYISTPKGMNHFYEIWQDAVAGKNNFIPCKIQWWEVEGRDEAWKERIIRNNTNGVQLFAQEYACLCGDEKVRIRTNGLVEEVTMEELAVRMSECV